MNKIKSNMVEYIKQTKEERKALEEKQKEEINTFLSQPDTQSLLKRYDRGLKHFYKYFAT